MVSELNFGLTIYGGHFHKSDPEVECPECGGEGVGYIEVWVDTYPNGGFLEERMGDCHNCDGSGYVAANEEDYDDE